VIVPEKLKVEPDRRRLKMSSASANAVRPTPTQTASDDTTAYVLRLQSEEEKKRLQWTSDTVDNEGMGKKTSKKCCIYHKKRAWNESDSESDGECDHPGCSHSH
jgi:protein phosphatase 1 regulatory subunit 11